jgi:hypothetical protein
VPAPEHVTTSTASPASTPAAEDPSIVAAEPALSGDDPIAAAAVLLDLRAGCFRSASLLCLDGVVQPGSSAEDADRAAVGAVQAGGEAPAPIVASQLELVERLGDSALVALGSSGASEKQPASLLLMKGEAGWRIRDYVAAS